MILENEQTELELLEALKGGSRAAYTEIYFRYKPLILAHTFKRILDRDACLDVVQDVFISLWNNRQKLDPANGVRGYLYISARNRVFDLLSRKKVEDRYIASLQIFLDQYNESTDYRFRYNQLTDIVDREIAQLPIKMQEVFKMSRTDQLSHKEIAEKLNISESTVKKQVQNALKILKKRLGPLFFIVFL